MSSSTARTTDPSFYTTQSWTVTEYPDPTTIQLYTIFVESTPIATIRLLPLSVGGGILLSNNKRLRPFDAPAIVDHALVGAIGDLDPTLMYSRIYDMVVSGPLSTPLLPIDMGTLAPLLSTSFRTSTSSGLGLPPASRTSLSTSRITPTGPVSAKDSANTSNADPWDGSFPDDEGASRPNAGMIAGISIGVIVGLLIILGSYIIVRRRKKARKNIENESDDTLAKRESDKMVVDPDEALYQSGAPHMSYRDHTQELDPSQPRTFSIHAHELRAYATPGELTRHHSVSRSEASPPDSSQDQDIEPTTQDEPVAPSQHVEAQRIRELEWLEMEEARLRQRREQLIRQSGEYSSRPADSQ